MGNLLIRFELFLYRHTSLYSIVTIQFLAIYIPPPHWSSDSFTEPI